VRRLHIIGGPGSGKSSVAGELARRLAVPAYDLDELFWDTRASRYGVRADVAERDRRLASIVAQDGWVIEGVWRVIRRFILRKVRRDTSRQESLTDLWRLLRWSHTYDARHLPAARESIAACGRRPVVCATPAQVFAAVSDVSARTR
jgi:adenylate kinase family enzyme